MRVAVYSRVSTSKDQSPALQVAELTEYCSARGWLLVESVVDHGFSGGSAERPGLRRLLELVRTRRVDAVVVLKLDRLFRSLRHMVTSLEEFESLGIKFVAVKDAIDYSTPSGRLFTHLLAAMAEFERGLIRERTILGLVHARRRGKTLGRPLKRNEAAIRKMREEGASYSQIQNRLGVSKGAVCRTLATPKRSRS